MHNHNRGYEIDNYLRKFEVNHGYCGRTSKNHAYLSISSLFHHGYCSGEMLPPISMLIPGVVSMAGLSDLLALSAHLG